MSKTRFECFISFLFFHFSWRCIDPTVLLLHRNLMRRWSTTVMFAVMTFISDLVHLGTMVPLWHNNHYEQSNTHVYLIQLVVFYMEKDPRNWSCCQGVGDQYNLFHSRYLKSEIIFFSHNSINKLFSKENNVPRTSKTVWNSFVLF